MINKGTPANGGSLYGDEDSDFGGGGDPQPIPEPAEPLTPDTGGDKQNDSLWQPPPPEYPAVDPVEPTSTGTISWGVILLFALAGLLVWYFVLRD